MSKRKVQKALEKPLIAFDFSHLSTSLSTLSKWTEQNEINNQNLKEEMERNHIQFNYQLDRIPSIEHDFGVLNGTMTRLKQQIEAWSSRFISLEEKYYGLSTKFESGIENLKSELDQTS